MSYLVLTKNRYDDSQRRTALVIHSINNNLEGDIRGIFSHLHASEAANIMHYLSVSQRSKLIKFLGDDFDYYILAFLEDAVREEILHKWANDKLGKALANLDEHYALEILSDLHPEHRKAILKLINHDDRVFLEKSLSYPEKSAGRLMSYQIVALPLNWTLEKTIKFLKNAKHLPEDFYYIFVVDLQNRPVGHISLSNVYKFDKYSTLSDCMSDEDISISSYSDQEEVALIFKQYSLVSAPVVNNNGKLIGVIDSHIVIDIIYREREEDFLHLAGVEDDGLHSNTIDTTKSRFKWLFMSSCTAMLSSSVIAQFQSVISKNAALAIVMPITASIGGNAGMQVVAVIIRALSNQQISKLNAARVLRKEITVALSNGVFFASLFGLISYFYISPKISLVFSLAILVNIVWSGFVGMMIPMILTKFRFDPALSAGSFLTASTDIVGNAAILIAASYFII